MSVDPDTQTPPTRIRASDVERLAVAEMLQDAVGRGLLSPTEGSERTAAAFAAVYRDDLGPLTADLPPPAPGRHHGRRSGRRARSAEETGSGRRRGHGTWWERAQTVAIRWWLLLVAVVSGWSPRRRILVGAAVAVAVVALIGLGVVGHDGGRGGPRGPADRMRG